MSKSLKDRLASAKLPERVVSVCLRADLVADHEAAERELEEVQRAGVDSLAGGGAAAIAVRIAALESQMREETAEVRLRALPRHKFRELLSRHAPREGEKLDQAYGCNIDILFPALIQACAVGTGMGDGDWSELFDEKLTDAQFQELALAAWVLNAREVDIPFSRAASRLRQATGGE